MRPARPRYDPWRDTDGTHVSDGCRVEQVEVSKAYGALPSRLHRRGVVTGRGHSQLRVLFDGEDKPTCIRPHLVRVLDEEAQP